MTTTDPVFRTLVKPDSAPKKISLGESILSLGSCFAENISAQLESCRFPVCSSPSGTLYNPLSIASNLERIIDGTGYNASDLFESDGRWKSFSHHSSFNASSPDLALATMNRAFTDAVTALSAAGTVIITLGTAWVYYLKSTGVVVANCHRLPHNWFERKMLTETPVVERWTSVIRVLLERFPSLNIILTVSPIRHLRDNPHENQVSKGRLLSAVYELEKQFESVYYFPSYEIMMDDLRDYRFYEANMTHPTAVAVDYIWDRFREACFDDEARRFVEKYRSIQQARNHRIQAGAGESTQRFARHMLRKTDAVQREFPAVNLHPDTDYFASLLS